MTYPIFQAGHRVRILSYGPFRGLIGTIRIVDMIVDLVEPFCFYQKRNMFYILHLIFYIQYFLSLVINPYFLFLMLLYNLKFDH